MKIKTNYEKVIYILFVFVFSLIIYFRNVLNINIPIIITTALIFIYAVISKESIAVILAFLIPFSSAIQGNYIVLMFIIMYLFRKKGKIKIEKNFFLLIIIFIIELINCFNDYSNIKEYITFILTLLLMYLIIYDNYDNNEKLSIIKNNILGICLSTFIYVLKTFKNVSISNFITYHYRLGLSKLSATFEGYNLSYNANEIALYALLGISLLTFLKNKNRIKNYIFYPTLSFFIIIGVLSQSRAFLLGLIFYLMLFICTNIKNIRKLIIITIGTICSIIIIYSFNANFFDNIISNYESRFDTTDITGGRTKNYVKYHNVIFSSTYKMLLGSGSQNYTIKNNIVGASHNATQELFICWGLIGGVSFIIILFTYLKQSKSKYKYSLEYYLPLISLLFMVQTIPFISQGIIILLIYVVLAPFGLYNSEGGIK